MRTFTEHAGALGETVGSCLGTHPVLLAASHNRSVAWLALAGGIWFVVGNQISRLWTAGGASAAGLVTGAVGH